MKLSYTRMNLRQLQQAIASKTKTLAALKKAKGEERLIKKYTYELSRLEYYENIRRDEQTDQDPKKVKLIRKQWLEACKDYIEQPHTSDQINDFLTKFRAYLLTK